MAEATELWEFLGEDEVAEGIELGGAARDDVCKQATAAFFEAIAKAGEHLQDTIGQVAIAMGVDAPFLLLKVPSFV